MVNPEFIANDLIIKILPHGISNTRLLAELFFYFFPKVGSQRIIHIAKKTWIPTNTLLALFFCNPAKKELVYASIRS